MSEGEDKPEVLGLLSNLVLLGTAGWGVWTCREHPFITAGFGLFAVRGLIGAVAYFDISDENFKAVKKHLFKFVDNFGFPLLAMDIMSCKCMRPAFSLLQLLGPAADFVGFEVDQEKLKEGDILAVAHSMTAGSAITCGQQKPEFWGSVIFPLPFVADILFKKIGDIKEAHDPLLALGVLLALLIMNGYIP
ncbi:uncharacterized protein [Halyomorpha halys]|uniref:uncharacterized protein isoform X2 n=1 Tax=Halyomorpha halys TaxID=286706 RepID=UPI0006D4F4F9|nr:uncharacterized protein LOC106688475 isoform X3 [Halyomorpha halys]